jgi:hypothetical protein
MWYIITSLLLHTILFMYIIIFHSWKAKGFWLLLCKTHCMQSYISNSKFLFINNIVIYVNLFKWTVEEQWLLVSWVSCILAKCCKVLYLHSNYFVSNMNSGYIICSRSLLQYQVVIFSRIGFIVTMHLVPSINLNNKFYKYINWDV